MSFLPLKHAERIGLKLNLGGRPERADNIEFWHSWSTRRVLRRYVTAGPPIIEYIPDKRSKSMLKSKSKLKSKLKPKLKSKSISGSPFKQGLLGLMRSKQEKTSEI